MKMPSLHDPWFVAVWPGMGRVARRAGEHLVEQLDVDYLGDYDVAQFFELDHVTVEQGVISPGARPRCLVFLWQDPAQRHDVILLLAESQPTFGAYALCEQLMRQVAEWGVTRVIAFAAMATQLHPSEPARVFGAATDEALLGELEQRQVEPLTEGQISGLNGLMLAAAQAHGIEGACLLGELPYFAVQVANPKASRAVLEVFTQMAGIEMDFTDLDREAAQIDEQLIQLLDRLQESGDAEDEGEGEDFPVEPLAEQQQSFADEVPLDPPTKRRIEQLFVQARQDRSKAFELKRELDRLGVFEQYEDRFLDLFTHGE
ncbi:MAG: PAC2 family protein [Phycisphaeraceae bacterium]